MIPTACSHASCRAPIVFARVMSTGNSMPFDAKPAAGGEWIINEDLLGGDVAEHVPAGLRDALLYVPHWATCPAAEEFRRREGWTS